MRASNNLPIRSVGINDAFGDDDFTVVATASITLDLPAAPLQGDTYEAKNGGAFTVTVDGNGNNIDGAATLTLSTAYQSATLKFNGTEWNQVASANASSGGNVVGYGSYASLPLVADRAPGSRYFASDAPYEFVNDGLLWRPVAKGVLCKQVPAISGFTAVNLGASTWSDAQGRWTIDAQSNGGAAFRAYVRSATSNVVVGVNVPVPSGTSTSVPSGIYPSVGAIIQASSTGAAVTLSHGWYSGGVAYAVLAQWSAPGTRTAYTIAALGYDCKFLKLQVSGGNVLGYISPNLKEWYALNNGSGYALANPNQAGSCAVPENTQTFGEVFHYEDS